MKFIRNAVIGIITFMLMLFAPSAASAEAGGLEDKCETARSATKTYTPGVDEVEEVLSYEWKKTTCETEYEWQKVTPAIPAEYEFKYKRSVEKCDTQKQVNKEVKGITQKKVYGQWQTTGAFDWRDWPNAGPVWDDGRAKSGSHNSTWTEGNIRYQTTHFRYVETGVTRPTNCKTTTEGPTDWRTSPPEGEGWKVVKTRTKPGTGIPESTEKEWAKVSPGAGWTKTGQERDVDCVTDYKRSIESPGEGWEKVDESEKVEVEGVEAAYGEWTNWTPQLDFEDGWTGDEPTTPEPVKGSQTFDPLIWEQTRPADSCDTPVAPVAPELVPAEKCGVESTVKIIEVEGVIYTKTREGNVVTVTAEPDRDNGYKVDPDYEGKWTWNFEIPAVEECEPEPTEPPVIPEPTEEPTVPVTPEVTPVPTEEPTTPSDTPKKPKVDNPTALAYTGADIGVLLAGALALLALGAGTVFATRRK